MKKTIIAFVALFTLTGIAYAATVPSEPAIYDSVISAPLGSSDTTIYLKSPTTTQATALSGFNCFTIDVNTPTLEYVCGTVSGSTVTGLTRNIDFFTATTTNQNTSVPSHRTGADIRITDFPFAQILHNIFSGSETIPSILHYAATTPSISSSDLFALASVQYVNAGLQLGCANASLVVNGCGQLATQIQMASSTASGSTGADLLLWSAYSTSTPGTAGLWNVISLNDGKLSPSWLNGTSELYTFNGTTTFAQGFVDQASSTIAANASNKLTLNGVPYVAPSSQGAAGTVLTNNGSGVESWAFPVNQLLFSTFSPPTVASSNASTTIFTFAVPANTLGTGGSVTVHIPLALEIVGSNILWMEASYGNATDTVELVGPGTNTQGEGYLDVILGAKGSTGSQSLTINMNALMDGVSNVSAGSGSIEGIAAQKTITESIDSTTQQNINLIVRYSASNVNNVFTPSSINGTSI